MIFFIRLYINKMEFKKLITSTSFIVAFLILLLTVILASLAFVGTMVVGGVGALPVLVGGVLASAVAFAGLKYMGH